MGFWIYKTKILYTFLWLVLANCSTGKFRPTTETTSVDTMYHKDSPRILSILKDRLHKHESSFYSQQFNDSTLLLIDTMLYNIDRNKVAVFVIAKNPTSNQLMPNIDYKFYYNAYCYLGKLDTVSHNWDLRWFRVFSLTNYYDLGEVSKDIRAVYFHELNSIKDAYGHLLYGSNINEEPFWHGKAWLE